MIFRWNQSNSSTKSAISTIGAFAAREISVSSFTHCDCVEAFWKEISVKMLNVRIGIHLSAGNTGLKEDAHGEANASFCILMLIT